MSTDYKLCQQLPNLCWIRMPSHPSWGGVEYLVISRCVEVDHVLIATPYGPRLFKAWSLRDLLEHKAEYSEDGVIWLPVGFRVSIRANLTLEDLE